MVLFFQSPIIRSFQTSTMSRDIDSAAKFIGAGAATVGVAGSGKQIVVDFIRCHECITVTNCTSPFHNLKFT